MRSLRKRWRSAAGRLYILDQIIAGHCRAARRAVKYAPKMFSMMIPVDKIKDVIGKGGKVIQEMCANFNCKIDIEEDGHVFISAVDQDDAKRAIATIKTIVEDPEIGAIYKGRVTRLMNFGAFVEIAPARRVWFTSPSWTTTALSTLRTSLLSATLSSSW